METEEEKKVSGFDQVRNMYDSLDLNSKIIISGALITVVVVTILLISFTFSPDYVLLYGGLDLKDSSEIINELDSQNVTYKVRAGGKSILVPLRDRDRMRISLAGKGFLPTSTTGYELFDQNRMTLSNFQQKIDYKRALEGELSRTLISLQEIEFARVHLVMPDPTPFLEDQSEPSASVVVKLSGAMNLKPTKMAAIANLIAGAVPGMDPSQVAVMDNRMNTISAGSSQDALNLALLPNQQLHLKRIEDSLTLKIKKVLEPAYGMGNITVAVSADLDFDKVQEQKTEYEPFTGSDTGILRSHDISETSTRNSPISSGGIAGASANLPSYQGTSNTDATSSKSDETTETLNYEVNEKSTVTEYAQGAMKRMSVSVLLNAESLDATEKISVESLVKDSVNFDTTRGDTLTVAAMVFDTTFEKEVEEARAKTIAAASKSMYITYGAIALVIALAAFSLMKLMKPAKLPEITLPSHLAHLTASAAAVDMPIDSADDIDISVQGPDPAAVKMREQVGMITRDKPEEAAKVIKTWLKE